MNFTLPHLPERTVKPRKKGASMIMDKGLSMRETENMIETCGELIDFLKLGFGTSIVTKNLKDKINLLKANNIKPYLGGTLFEAYVVRGLLDDYLKLVDKFEIETIEISDGSILMEHEVKCKYIHKLSQNYTILSEVGTKEAGIITAPNKWITMMDKELEAGSDFVIAEARESGTVGIYRPSGVPHVALVNKIINKIPQDKILWEAPKKSQQIWFIKQLGANVNLGNLAPNEVIPVETLRLGLRGDTFFTFLPDEFKKKQIPKPKPKKPTKKTTAKK